MVKSGFSGIKIELKTIISTSRFRLVFLVIGFVCLIIARQLVGTFGISFGYIYVVLITLTGFWFGIKGGLIAALFSCLIFLAEIIIFKEWPVRELALKGIIFRFSVYFIGGIVVGYLSEQEKKLYNKVEYLSYHDRLTGCVNYSWVMDFLETEISRSRRFIRAFTIALIDIDYFKRINDRYGHLVGNDALAAFANVLKNNLRNMDIVGRYGGEEFLLILPEINTDGASVLLERIRSELAKTKITSPYLKEKVDIHIQFSSGVASFPHNANNLRDLISVADDALYQAKRTGRNKAVIEKRRCIRLKPAKGLRVNIAKLSNREKLKIQKVDNISERGMLLLFSQDIPSEEFLCRISISEQDFPPEFTCRIAHKTKLNNGSYRVGIYFVDVPIYTRGKLSNFINSS